MKTVYLYGHRWTIHPSTLGENYRELRRVAYRSDLARFGQVTTGIDVTTAALDKLHKKY